MGVAFTPWENRVLYRLLVENSTDVILKSDREGNILHASPPLQRLGLLRLGEPAPQHLRDLIEPARAAPVLAAHAAAFEGREDRAWLEFQARGGRWFAIQTRGIGDERGRIGAAISIVRSIEERIDYEQRLFAAAMTDPLTGLTNRPAFVAMLRHLVERGADGCVAILAIDHFKAINLRCGHAAGDRVLVAVADLLRALTRADDIISRIGGESFGILLPGVKPEHAEAICAGIVLTLSELSGEPRAGRLPITLSAGLAEIAPTLDETIRAAELALVVAKAKGRNRVEVDRAGLRQEGLAYAASSLGMESSASPSSRSASLRS